MGARGAFALSQIFVLAVIAGALYLYFRRNKPAEGSLHDDDMARARARIAEIMKNDESARAAASFRGGGQGRNGAPPSPALTSALPSWTAATPPHAVLGVPSDAKHQVVEMAYRALVKKYHPDRFSSWGSEYMDRAHEITILLQKARDALLKNSA